MVEYLNLYVLAFYLINLFLVCSQIKGIQQNKEMTLASNRLLAEQNLKLQPMLDHQKNELTRRYRSLQELFEAYQLRNSTLGKILRLKHNFLLSLFIFLCIVCPSQLHSSTFTCTPSWFFILHYIVVKMLLMCLGLFLAYVNLKSDNVNV